jgi:hypothetical protein
LVENDSLYTVRGESRQFLLRLDRETHQIVRNQA